MGYTRHMEVGRLISSLNPQVFNALLAKIDDTKQTAVQDMSKIPVLFETFCRMKDLDPNDLIYTRSKDCVVVPKRLFIAAMVTMYDPLYIAHYSDALRYRLREAIATAIGAPATWVSKVAQESRFEYYNLKGFAEELEQIIMLLKINYNCLQYLQAAA